LDEPKLQIEEKIKTREEKKQKRKGIITGNKMKELHPPNKIFWLTLTTLGRTNARKTLELNY